MSSNGLFNVGWGGCSALRPQLGSDPCFSELQEQTGICGMIRFVNIRRKEVMWLDMDGGGGLG